MRINRFLARTGIASRRKSEAILLEGRVTINGLRVDHLATEVSPQDIVCVDGKHIAWPQERLLLAYHKPVGLLCSHSDPHASRLIYDDLPKDLGLFSIGRLDRDSEGLLLITNDGILAQSVAHPSMETEKEYVVVLNRPFVEKDRETLLRGVSIEGSLWRMDAVKPYTSDAGLDEILPQWPPKILPTRIVRVLLHEGHKREIRRLFAALQYRVLRLVRVRVAEIQLYGILPGDYRVLEGSL